MNDDTIIDLMIHDGLWDIFNNYHMGVTAENVSAQFDISREEQDSWSLISQERAQKAIKQDASRTKSCPWSSHNEKAIRKSLILTNIREPRTRRP